MSKHIELNGSACPSCPNNAAAASTFQGEASFSGRSHTACLQPPRLIWQANRALCSCQGLSLTRPFRAKVARIRQESSKQGHFINSRGQVREPLSRRSLSTVFEPFLRRCQELNSHSPLYKQTRLLARVPEAFPWRGGLFVYLGILSNCIEAERRLFSKAHTRRRRRLNRWRSVFP